MLRRETVLILGAGASVDFGMPTGAELLDQFDEAFDMRTDRGEAFFEALARRSSFLAAQYHAASPRIRRVLHYTNSIDELLHRLEDQAVTDLGKAAITYLIAQSENESFLASMCGQSGRDWAEKPENTFSKTWVPTFVRYVAEGVQLSRIGSLFERLRIVTFNYDRCLETALIFAVADAYGVDLNAATKAVSTLPIDHVYGSIGPLPWQEENGRAFGGRPSFYPLENAKEELRTYTESNIDEDDKVRWRAWLAGAEQMIFLGFGFHEQNLELIRGKYMARQPHVFATSYKARPEHASLFEERLSRLLFTGDQPHDWRFAQRDCADWAETFGPRITS